MSRLSDRWRTTCLSGLGAGFLWPASGTWASLAATSLYLTAWLVLIASAAPRAVLESLLALGILGASWLSVRWGPWAVARWNACDPRQFTLDEFAGQWVALVALPLSMNADAWSLVCVAGGQFVLFRIFDIFKPFPARQCEALPAGWGILMDDLFAGLYANLAGQLVWRLLPLAAWLGVRLA